MPKTAGITFRQLLSIHFGESLSLDYKDFPINKSFQIRTSEAIKNRQLIHQERNKSLLNIKCIHGHFMPYKFMSYKEDGKGIFITWLRDPLERLASHYFFWKRAYKKEKSAPLHKRVVEEEWSLEKFCFSEEMQNTYSNFLWNFPKEYFSFIGITEHFDEDIQFFAESYLSRTNFEIISENRNPDGSTSYFNDHGLIRELKEWHAADYQIYDYARTRRDQRLFST